MRRSSPVAGRLPPSCTLRVASCGGPRPRRSPWLALGGAARGMVPRDVPLVGPLGSLGGGRVFGLGVSGRWSRGWSLFGAFRALGSFGGRLGLFLVSPLWVVRVFFGGRLVWSGGGSRFLRTSFGTVNGGFTGAPVLPLIHDDLLAGAHCYPAARSTRRGKKKNLEALIVHFG